MTTRRLRTAAALAFLAASGLVACSKALQMTLVNDSGRVLSVLADGAPPSSGPGASATFDYPRSDQQWRLTLRTPDCELVYVMPSTLDDYPWHWENGLPFRVQLERDLRLHQVPQTAVGVVDIATIAGMQTNGFPLKPMSSSCRK